MNSIFVEICRQFLFDIIDTATESSNNADRSVQNAVLGYIGWERKPELAEDKRIHLKKLKAAIENYNPMTIDDQIAFDSFNEYLTTTRRAILELSRNKDKSEGITGSALAKSIDLIHAIFEQLRHTLLLNIPRDNDPLSIFQYYIACYFATKVVSQPDKNSIQQIVESSQVSNFKKRERERMILILEIMKDCQDAVGGFDIALHNYNTLVKREVITQIERLKTGDAQLTTKYGPSLSTITYVLSFAKIALSDETLLTTLLNDALTKIKQPTQNLPKVATSEWDDVRADMTENEEETARTDILQLERTERQNINRFFEHIPKKEQLPTVGIVKQSSNSPTINAIAAVATEANSREETAAVTSKQSALK